MSIQEMLTEPVIIPDTFVTNLVKIEQVGGEGYWRFTFACQQESLYGGGNDYVVQARLVLSASLVISSAKAALMAVGARCLCMARNAIHH